MTGVVPRHSDLEPWRMNGPRGMSMSQPSAQEQNWWTGMTREASRMKLGGTAMAVCIWQSQGPRRLCPGTLAAFAIPLWLRRPWGSLESFWSLVYTGKTMTLGSNGSKGQPEMRPSQVTFICHQEVKADRKRTPSFPSDHQKGKGFLTSSNLPWKVPQWSIQKHFSQLIPDSINQFDNQD